MTRPVPRCGPVYVRCGTSLSTVLSSDVHDCVRTGVECDDARCVNSTHLMCRRGAVACDDPTTNLASDEPVNRNGNYHGEPMTAPSAIARLRALQPGQQTGTVYRDAILELSDRVENLMSAVSVAVHARASREAPEERIERAIKLLKTIVEMSSVGYPLERSKMQSVIDVLSGDAPTGAR